jgi:hypothetical protein
MNTTEKMRTIKAVRATAPAMLHIRWSDGTRADIDLGALLRDRAFRRLRDAAEFAKASVGDWGHSITWPSGTELSAETLWLETLSATRPPARRNTSARSRRRRRQSILRRCPPAPALGRVSRDCYVDLESHH